MVAIQKALEQAEEFEDEGDIDAANLLRAQAAKVKAKLDGTQETSTALVPYDPMRLYARLVRKYNGGIRDEDFARMDYRRFFGYVRELDLMLEEEAKASNGTSNPKKQTQGEIQAALNQFPQPQPYEGETIPLI